MTLLGQTRFLRTTFLFKTPIFNFLVICLLFIFQQSSQAYPSDESNLSFLPPGDLTEVIIDENDCLPGVSYLFYKSKKTTGLHVEIIETGANYHSLPDNSPLILNIGMLSDTLVAVDDDTTTTTISPVNIDVLGNDLFPDSCTFVVNCFIGKVENAIHGSADIQFDNTITYWAEAGFCGGLDSFTYFISNGVISDTATVVIEVLCDDIMVYNGFSPNGDNQNDTWQIRGIENYPNNIVTIWNRWGNRVFYREGYSNADGWDGKLEGKDQPDGTYFYIIDDGIGNQFSGWIMLLR